MKKLLTLLLLFSCLIIRAQDTLRPKIGVVLSGGGAKGLAHIGVLKVLEENGVKVDYIAGTSMGAIVGGLYASGYTATELDSIFRNVNTEAIVQDFVPRTSKSFYEKRNNEVYALQLPFEDFKLTMPKALSKGMYNNNLLSRLLAHVRYERDFSQLSIPFACVATDLVTGEKVVLREGNLTQSILASGAFPSLYTPMELNGRTLIDGGIADNYPVDIVREMGADIVIGVDVQDGLKELDDLKGMPDILFQISNYSMVEEMPRKIKETDYYIKPDIKGFSVVSFGNGTEIIQRGADAARKFQEDFRQLGQERYVNNPPNYVEKSDEFVDINNIHINGIENYTRNYIYGKIKLRPYQHTTFSKLVSGMNDLNATQNFSSISYEFAADSLYDNCDDLYITLKENPIRRFAKFSIHYDGLYKSAALVNLTQKKMLFKNDVASLDAIFGDNFRYFFNYYVDNGYLWSVGVQSKLNTLNRSIEFNDYVFEDFPELKAFTTKYIDLTNRLYFQTYYRERFRIGLGFEHKFNQVDLKNIRLGKPWLDKSHYFSAFGNITFDTYDDKYFPTKGTFFTAEYKHYFHSSDYNDDFSNFSQITAELATTKTFFKRLSVELKGNVGITIGTNTPTFLNYFLGGYGFESVYNIQPFYGYDFLSLFNDSFIKGSFRIDYEILKKHHLNFSGNYAQIGNGIFEYSDWLDKPEYSGYALGYGYQSVIGPIEIKHSWSPETRSHFTWFAVGFWF